MASGLSDRARRRLEALWPQLTGQGAPRVLGENRGIEVAPVMD
jgi:hypothetical protein